VLGGKHPHMLGKPGSEVWEDLWARVEIVFKKNEGTYDDALLLVIETYFKFSYNPIPGDNGRTKGYFVPAPKRRTALLMNVLWRLCGSWEPFHKQKFR